MPGYNILFRRVTAAQRVPLARTFQAGYGVRPFLSVRTDFVSAMRLCGTSYG